MTAIVNKRVNPTWWLTLSAGISLLVVSLFLIAWPNISVKAIILVMSLYWFVDGIFSLIKLFLKATAIHQNWLLLKSIIGILGGLVVVSNLLLGLLAIAFSLIMLALQGIMMGAIGFMQAFKDTSWGAGITATISIIFGLILLSAPMLTQWLLPNIMGLIGLLGCILLLLFAFQLYKKEIEHG